MNLQIELWQIISLLLAFFAACGAFGKLLLDQMQRHLDERFQVQEEARQEGHQQLARRLDAIEAAKRDEAKQWLRVERELLELKADLPMRFVQREDYIRGQSVIEVKIDSLALKIENIQLRAPVVGEHHVR